MKYIQKTSTQITLSTGAPTAWNSSTVVTSIFESNEVVSSGPAPLASTSGSPFRISQIVGVEGSEEPLQSSSH